MSSHSAGSRIFMESSLSCWNSVSGKRGEDHGARRGLRGAMKRWRTFFA